MNMQETKDYIREQIYLRHGTMKAYDAHRGHPSRYISTILANCKRSIPNWLLADFGLCKVVSYEPRTPKESKIK